MGLISKLGLKEKRGKSKSIDFYDNGNVKYVSASTENSGISEKEVSIAKEAVNKSGTITVAIDGQGSVGFTQIQSLNFTASSHVAVIECESLTIEEKLVLAAVIRLNRWRFGFGRAMGGRIDQIDFDLKQFKLLIDKVKELKLKEHIADGFDFEKKDYEELVLKIKGKTMSQLFNFIAYGKKCKTFNTGDIAVVSASEYNNGVIGYTTKNKISKTCKIINKPTITVAKDGKPGVARVQTSSFTLANSHVFALEPKIEFNTKELFILASLIEDKVWKFSYGRAAGKERLGSLILYP